MYGNSKYNLVVNAKPTVTAVASCVSGVGRITVTASGTGLTYNIGTGNKLAMCLTT
ncbi:MAG: hypothetical protein IPN94_16675 [Sphingobacteriales bacterium]|nr:hypothetical protein [Sphingobacteriales bacterium]